MAVALRSSSGAVATSAGNSPSASPPAGVALGDVLIAIVGIDRQANAQPSFTTIPTGWTQLDIDSATSSNANLNATGATFYKIATASESTYTWTFNGAALSWAVAIQAWSGGASTSPAHGIAHSTSDATTFPTPVISVPVANAAIVDIGVATASLAAGPTLTYPANTTLDLQENANITLTFNPTAGIGHDNANQSSAGSSTARTLTAGSASPWVTATVAITPPVTPQPAPPVTVSQAVQRAASF